MSPNDKRAGPVGPRSPHGPVSAGRRSCAHVILRILSMAVIVATLPVGAGCSPELMVATLILGPTLYAHLDQGCPRTKPSAASASSVRPDIQTNAATRNKGTSSIPGRTRRTRSAQAVSPSTPATAGADRPCPRQPTSACPVAEGVRAYRELRWDEAIRILSQVVAGGTCPDSALGQAYVFLGAIVYQRGDIQAARRYFVAAYRYDPQTRPSSELFPPPVVDYYRTANQTDGR